MNRIPIVAMGLVVLSSLTLAFVIAQNRPPAGELGYGVGTDIVIEGATVERLPWSSAHPGAAKYAELLVLKINGRTLTIPQWMTLANLDFFIIRDTVPNNVLFRFRGHEITQATKNPDRPSSGKDFEFEVTEILSPAGLELRAK